MFRRCAFACFAALAIVQTGCHGRIHAFFYRLTHCCDCAPHYGPACCPPSYHGPMYAGPGCCPAPGPTMIAAPYGAMPVSQSMGQPVFQGMPQPMPGPNVYPTPAPPPAEKK